MRITTAQSGRWVSDEYGSVCPSNEIYLLLIAIDHFCLFRLVDGMWTFWKDLPIGASEEPRWSDDPNILYYVRGTTLFTYNVLTDESTPIRTFGLRSLSGKGESDFSNGHLVFCVDDAEIVLYNTVADTSQSVPFTSDFESLYVTPDNNVLISGSTGMWRYRFSDKSMLRISPSNGHKDVTRDPITGDEVLIWTNSAETPVTLPDFQNGIVMIRLADGKQLRGLLSDPWIDAVDISCADGVDFCAVSTYGAEEPIGRIYKTQLDGSGSSILIDGINHNVTEYNKQPKASLSRKGTFVVYTSANGDTGISVDTWVANIANSEYSALDLSNQAGRCWGFMAQQSGNVIMYDVNPSGWSPIKLVKGNTYEFTAVSETELQMLLKRGNV